jgi:hypothetical protein
MKKPKLQVNEQPQPRNIQRADIAPTDGYALVVDGHFKTQFAENGTAMKAACEVSDVADRNLRRSIEVTNLG